MFSGFAVVHKWRIEGGSVHSSHKFLQTEAYKHYRCDFTSTERGILQDVTQTMFVLQIEDSVYLVLGALLPIELVHP